MGAFEYRPATAADAAFAADVYTFAHPDEPVDPVMLRYEWESGSSNWSEDRSLICLDGRPVGYAYLQHPRWEVATSRFATINAELLPAHRTAGALADALETMERRAASAGATLAATRVRDGDAILTAALADRGFREDRRTKRWELDLVAQRDRVLAMTEESRARMRGEGVRLLTLADDVDPDRYRKIWRLNDEAGRDVPSTLGYVEESLDDLMSWLRMPGMHADRFWIARERDEIVGVSVLEYPPVRGVVNTGWTATARSARGRGIARALKCETVAQAIALGIDRVRTGNDAKNAPILHLNETMGYHPFLTRISFHKQL
jgi:GNAT superfamily N-acetyltransferase